MLKLVIVNTRFVLHLFGLLIKLKFIFLLLLLFTIKFTKVYLFGFRSVFLLKEAKINHAAIKSITHLKTLAKKQTSSRVIIKFGKFLDFVQTFVIYVECSLKASEITFWSFLEKLIKRCRRCRSRVALKNLITLNL